MSDLWRAVYYTQLGDAILADCGHDHSTREESEACHGSSDGSYNAVGRTEDGDEWEVWPLGGEPDGD